jgi:CheY-like chemotaxis protein
MPHRGQRVLWVDDATTVGRFGHDVLTCMGYEVVVTTRGQEALATFQAAPQNFAVLITDDTMPGLSGIELATACRQIRVDLPIILLSLSRLNHWLPRVKTHPEIMPRPADFHDEIADALLPQPDPVFDDATTLHTAVDMLDPQPTAVPRLVGHLLFPCEILATRFLGGHEALDLGQRKRQKAQVLQQPTPGGQGIRRGGGNRFIMDTAAVGVTEKEDDEQGIHEQDIFNGVVLFLATITVRLFSRVLGADDAPFGPVMGTRGDAGAAAGSSASGVITVAASASETPKRCARAVRERAGASPRVRSAVRRAGRRTWIH